jgi:integrase
MWVERLIFFHHVRHPAEMAEAETNAFLTRLAVEEKVSASTRNQALSALLSLYSHVPGREIGQLREVIRARKLMPLPVALTREEVKAVLCHPTGHKSLIASLMNAAGLRLHVQDTDFSCNVLLVCDGRGAEVQITMLPDSLSIPLQEHLRKVKRAHERDLADAWGRVPLPNALDRKRANAPREWRRQLLFPPGAAAEERQDRR